MGAETRHTKEGRPVKISSISSVGATYKAAESRPERKSAALTASAAKASVTKASAAKTSPASASSATQEAKETVAQTAKEAANGDQQAVRLQAREQAAAAKSAPTQTGSRRVDIIA
jgi:cytoskeletal protein RodZ